MTWCSFFISFNFNGYEVTNPNEYKELEEAIAQALQNCISKINRSNVPKCSTIKMEQLTTTETAS